ncbi:hypothetical protein EYC80_005183 [Monilinia laxa]|uniref:Uncharacterized protein n=1 Tax=Monilinia laxa TaxID=61186 RepID=A0A5N6KKT8_MONLA|nr:hypothetical protein EYC80_005183 [Monilinia laxa]
MYIEVPKCLGEVDTCYLAVCGYRFKYVCICMYVNNRPCFLPSIRPTFHPSFLPSFPPKTPILNKLAPLINPPASVLAINHAYLSTISDASNQGSTSSKNAFCSSVEPEAWNSVIHNGRLPPAVYAS